MKNKSNTTYKKKGSKKGSKKGGCGCGCSG
jgi:hypothetical protein